MGLIGFPKRSGYLRCLGLQSSTCFRCRVHFGVEGLRLRIIGKQAALTHCAIRRQLCRTLTLINLDLNGLMKT